MRYPLVIIAASLYLILLVGAYYANSQGEDFTDTGVGCLDDCLEPMIKETVHIIVI